MKKAVFLNLLLILILVNLSPNPANAYSYGDPNEEKLAEVYKEMQLKLDQTPPDFSAANSLFLTVKEEVDMHMGPEPSDIILDNIEAKDKNLTLENMDKLLILNIARRLESISNQFSEYDTSKKLLAKGFATYQALSSKVEAVDPAKDKEIKNEFDKALEALGNPGLFGVGKKPSNLDAFNKSKEKILKSLQEQFGLASLEVGHFSESASEGSSEKKDWTDLSSLRNWLPIAFITALISAVIIIGVRKRRK